MTDTDIKTLVERLRERNLTVWAGPAGAKAMDPLCGEAADALEALQERVKGSDTLKAWQEFWQARAEKAEAALAERNAAS